MNVITLSTEENEALRVKHTQEELFTIESFPGLVQQVESFEEEEEEDNEDGFEMKSENEVEGTNNEIKLPVLVKTQRNFHFITDFLDHTSLSAQTIRFTS